MTPNDKRLIEVAFPLNSRRIPVKPQVGLAGVIQQNGIW